MKKTILITGGAGYIGSAVAYIAAQGGYKVIIVDKVKGEFNSEKITQVGGDILDSKFLDKVFSNNKIEFVIHLVGAPEPTGKPFSVQEVYKLNFSSTMHLLASMMKHGVKNGIFSSSASVYAASPNTQVAETWQRNPQEYLGKSKLALEDLVQEYHHNYGLNYVLFRIFSPAGAIPELSLGERHKHETHVIPLAINSLYKQEPLSIPIHHSKEDFVHIADIGNAYLCAIEHLHRVGVSEIFNLGSGVGHTITDILNKLEELGGKKIILNKLNNNVQEPKLQKPLADISKAATILNWKPKYSDLDFILRSASRFYNTNNRDSI